MTNLSVTELENEALRDRLAAVKKQSAALVAAVERYTTPKPGEFCHRSDLLRIKDNLKATLR